MQHAHRCGATADVREAGTQSSRSPPSTGFVGIGNLSTTSGRAAVEQWKAPRVRPNSSATPCEPSATSVDIHSWLTSGGERSSGDGSAVARIAASRHRSRPSGRAFAGEQGPGPFGRTPTEGSRCFRSHPTDDQAMLRDAAKELATECPATRRQRAADSAAAYCRKWRSRGRDGTHLVGVPTTLDGIAESGTAVTAARSSWRNWPTATGPPSRPHGTASSPPPSHSWHSRSAGHLPSAPDRGAADGRGAGDAGEPQPLFDATTPRTNATREGDDLVVTGNLRSRRPGRRGRTFRHLGDP